MTHRIGRIPRCMIGLSFATRILRSSPRGRGPILSLLPESFSGESILTIELQRLPGAFNFEYKTRERIQRAVADARLLAIPASWSRVADSNLN